MTMDSWSSGIARIIIYEHGYPMAATFFISYIFIAGIVMTNVVVAILLDKYLEAMEKPPEIEGTEETNEQNNKKTEDDKKMRTLQALKCNPLVKRIRHSRMT